MAQGSLSTAQVGSNSRATSSVNLPAPEKHRLDVGGGRLLAANLGEISVVMHRQHQLVVRPELAQIETLGAVEVLVLETLRSELSGDGNARVVCGAAMCVASVCGVRS